MKKISLLVFVFVMIFLGQLYAEDNNSLTNSEQNFPKPLPKIQAKPKDNLVSSDESVYRARLKSLEQQVRGLEQSVRFQDEKINSLERSLEAVKRRLR